MKIHKFIDNLENTFNLNFCEEFIYSYSFNLLNTVLFALTTFHPLYIKSTIFKIHLTSVLLGFQWNLSKWSEWLNLMKILIMKMSNHLQVYRLNQNKHINNSDVMVKLQLFRQTIQAKIFLSKNIIWCIISLDLLSLFWWIVWKVHISGLWSCFTNSV